MRKIYYNSVQRKKRYKGRKKKRNIGGTERGELKEGDEREKRLNKNREIGL